MDEALDHVVTKFKSIAVRSGADAIGVFGGGGLTNEKAYMLGKFARVALRTANIDYNGRFCMASAAAAGLRAFGIDRGMPFPMEDIAKAQAVMMIGGNPAETLPVIMQYLEAQREAGGPSLSSTRVGPERRSSPRFIFSSLPELTARWRTESST
jgi:assimilatory nitrate reductase catalytic subunit